MAPAAPSSGEDVTASVELRSFGDLQTQLRAMSYSEPVGVESVLLVRRLLTDILAASTDRDKAEKALEKAQRDALEFSQILLPLRKENAQLTRENNSLHLEIIHQEEAITEREKTCELQLEGLRDDLKKLQFVNGQKSQQCTKKDQEIAKLHARLERVLATGGGNLDASQGIGIDMRGSDVSQSLRRLSIDSPQARNTAHSEQNGHAQVAKDLQEQLAEVMKDNTKLCAQCEQLNDKLSKREQEIGRLSKLSMQVVNNEDTSKKLHELEERYQAKSKQDATELHVDQLSTQVDLLNDQVAKYERRLKDATDQIRVNDGIAEKLQQAELDRDHFVKELSVLQAKYHVLEEEHSRCGDSYLEPGSPRKQTGPSNSPEAQDEGQGAADLASLNEQVRTLATHKDRLEDALRAMHYDKISYTNALSNANSHNRVLTSDLARAEAKLKELDQEKAKLEQVLADTRASLDAHTRELDVLRESLKQSEESYTLDKEKNASLHRELRSMDKLLSQRDDECRSLNRALLVQKSETERLTGKLDRLEAATSGDGGDDTQNGKKAVFAQEMKWLEEERHDLRREKEEFMVQIMDLEQDLQKAKKSLQEAEHENAKQLEKANVSTKNQVNLEGMLEAKKHECADIQRQLIESKGKLRELTDKESQAKVLLSRAEETENEKIVVQNEALALKRHVEELRDQNASLKNRAENGEQYAKRLTDQIQKLQTDAAVTTQKCSTLEKEKAELQNSYDSAIVELRNARQTWNHYQHEFEKLSSEVQAQQHSLSSGQNALQSSQSSVSDLRNQLVLLQDELLQTKEVNRAREIALKQLRAEIQSKDRALTEKTEAVENFKLLIEQMESSRDQMVFQTKQRQQQIQRHQQEMDDLNAKVSSLETDISTKNNEIASLKKLTRTLDSEKDVTNDQLDALTEKYHELEKQSKELRKTMQSRTSDTAGLQEQMGNLINKLNEAEDKLSKMQAHCSRLETEVDRLEHLKGMHTAELAALAQDLENMTVENQAISEECTRLQRVDESHSKSAKNMKQTTREVERERDIMQVELEDLRHTYRSLILEHEGMQKAQEAQTKCEDLEDRLAQQDDIIRKLERSRSKFKRFAAKYEREIEQRDRKIEELRSSNASSFVSPDARSLRHRWYGTA
ncbi:hypothetical protein BBJ29_003937 [Phytophthora kernoviae]|uniref:Uncharacterized protein n=1 Tax=Phytophthora kernoviae TaxID=325452 RepID=A0A3F2S166_9STRA|nr:hypothetical protein BBJ29_003937 [Phytophthora kernoviae]RLN67402.1 hypothetical protein BBP00_00001652 [Phytophthora kernoviae]